MTVLALVIGVTVGMLVRRSVPAMAVTLVAVVAVQLLLPAVVQGHLLPPKELTAELTREKITELSGRPDPPHGIVIERMEISIDSPGAWITTNRTVDSSGRVVEQLPSWTGDCATPPGETNAASQACFDRLAAEGYRQHVTYHPASRFWPLQLIETGLLLALAGLLTGFCFWRIRRDLT